MPILPGSNTFLTLTLKKHVKTVIKVFPCLTLLDFLVFLGIFCVGLSVETNANLLLAPVSCIFQFFEIFCNLKVFLKILQKKIMQSSREELPYLEVLRKPHLACLI